MTEHEIQEISLDSKFWGLRDYHVVALCERAGDFGDETLVVLCDKSLAGDEHARNAVAERLASWCDEDEERAARERWRQLDREIIVKTLDHAEQLIRDALARVS